MVRTLPKFFAAGRLRRWISALGTLADPGGEFLDVIEDFTSVGHLIENLLLRIHHRGVVPAERLADLRQGQIGQFAAEIHGDLAGLGQCPGLSGPAQFLDGGVEVFCGGGHDRGCADLHGAGVRDEVAQHDLGQGGVDRGLVQRCECRDPDQSALEFADIAFDAAGDQFEDIIGYREAVHLRFLAEDGDPGFQFGGLDVGDQAPLEPGPEPVLQGGELFWRPIRRDHDLLVRVVEGVEGMEELFLDTFLALDELNVIDQQHVDISVAPFEGDFAVVTQGVDEIVGEFFGGDVLDPHPGKQPLGVVAGGMQEVSLAQAGSAVDEQWVVAAAGTFGHRQCCGMGEAIRWADDETLEIVTLRWFGARAAVLVGTRGPAIRGRAGDTGCIEIDGQVEIVVDRDAVCGIRIEQFRR